MVADEGWQGLRAEYTLEATNLALPTISLAEFKAFGGVNAYQADLPFASTISAVELGNEGMLTTNELLTISETLAVDETTPIILSLEYLDPSSSERLVSNMLFYPDGSIAPDHDGDLIVDTLDDLPFNPDESDDSDGDGIGNNADFDDDNDGLTDEEEATLGTDPVNPDTDGDSLDDGFEVAEGLNPLDGTDCPAYLCEASSLLKLILLLEEL